ncbi:MAG TPA: peptidylprolyl isomerase [Candidatus Limnocylindrales bacterium]|nr:peptidylprolyl isomerase [Candidatus Limnocylindrales bacterium]
MRPAIHFLLLGLMLLVGTRYWNGAEAGEDARRRIVIDASRIEGIRRAYAVGMGAPPTEAELQALLDKTVEEEVLFREALARGLELSDRAIGWRLVQKMRFLGEDDGNASAGELYRRALEMGLHLEDPVVRRILVQKMRLLVGHRSDKPSDEELASYYRTHGQALVQPQRVSLRHVFFDASRRGEDGSRAEAERAARSAASAATFGRGDPFVMGSRLAAQSHKDLAKLFGAEFADAIFASGQTGQWFGPIRSAYGWHVVQVDERRGARVPELEAVRSQVERSLAAERAGKRVQEFLQTARRAYEVRLELGATRGGGDA